MDFDNQINSSSKEVEKQESKENLSQSNSSDDNILSSKKSINEGDKQMKKR